MAEYLIQSETLDDIADAINAKTGGSSAMTPAQMVSAIAAIPSGGGAEQLLASGQYVLASEGATQITIPISFSGTATKWLVVVAEPKSGVVQAYSWAENMDLPSEMAAALPYGMYDQITMTASGQFQETHANYARPTFSNTNIVVKRFNTQYPILPNTYNWYVWGYAE